MLPVAKRVVDAANAVDQGPAERRRRDFETAGGIDLDALGKRQGGGAEVVDVHVARHQELVVLEMVELDVADRVRHVVFPGEEGLFPAQAALADDARQAGDVQRQFVQQEFWAEGAAAQLGMRHQAAVAALGHMVRQLVGEGKTDAARYAVGTDQVQAGQFGFFARVCGKGRNRKILVGMDHRMAAALEVPFGGDARQTVAIGAPTFQAQLEQPQ
ncbi:hypothetical protein LP416_13545 [Polaromonas sp. P2-4]|nr:hypothetical protein LP416_13545 [Polaromonas sp. P2-4]